ncbi:MAG: hypothetical protein JW974_03135 [Alphaproteobacteria bacterium]|nr:hypothetical protein [Alphaproteobacteria bacterium]MBN2674909.1 hypothetical protein [Alphaproteobacteria bacterium]
MFKNKFKYYRVMPYNIKKALLIILVSAFMASCEKDDVKDPIKEQIDFLRADSVNQASAVRTSILPAKTNPDDITDYFDMVYNQATAIIGQPQNLFDSSYIFMDVVNFERRVASSTHSETLNDSTMTLLYNNSDKFRNTVMKLQNLYTKTK